MPAAFLPRSTVPDTMMPSAAAWRLLLGDLPSIFYGASVPKDHLHALNLFNQPVEYMNTVTHRKFSFQNPLYAVIGRSKAKGMGATKHLET